MKKRFERNTPTMILSEEDRELFYLLYDSITLYANGRLGVSDHLFYGDPQMVDEYEQTKVAEELWKTPSLVDDYLRSEDSESLMPDEADQLRAWDAALEGTFAVSVQPDGRALFLSDGYAFEVWGITREISEVLGEGQSFVSAALLPFAGKIVYGGYLNQVSAEVGGATGALLTVQAQAALHSGSVVRSDTDFVRASGDIAESRVQREVDSMFDDLDALGDDTCVEGTHRGVLAGLSAEERASAVAAHGESDSLPEEDADLVAQALSEASLVGRPVEDLRGLLLTQTKEELEWLARAWRVRGFSSLSKDALATRLAKAMANDAPTLRRYVLHASEQQVRALHALSDAGGRVDVESPGAGLVEAISGLPLFFEPVVYLFSWKGQLAAVIPEELRGIVAGLDWGALEADAHRRQGILDFAASLVELRGIVELREAYEEYERVFPDAAAGFESFKEELEGHVSGEGEDYELLESGDVYYLVYYDLADEYADAMRRMGGFRESLGDRAYLHGPLSPLLDAILSNRRGKVARPMDAELAASDGVLNWELSLPPVAALLRFFDANVPDGADDYRFGLETVDAVCSMAHGGYAPQEYLTTLSDLGFVIDRSHARRFMQLVQNAVAAVPNWFENGWSQVEANEMATGMKTFYNEDGSPMRVGGNDPCPCGSGKKYKDCHGAPRQ